MKKMQMKGQISRWHPTGKPGGWASLVLLRSMTSTATNDDPAGFSVPPSPGLVPVRPPAAGGRRDAIRATNSGGTRRRPPPPQSRRAAHERGISPNTVNAFGCTLGASNEAGRAARPASRKSGIFRALFIRDAKTAKGASPARQSSHRESRPCGPEPGRVPAAARANEALN